MVSGLATYHRPTCLLVGFVVFVFPRRATAVAAVLGDGDVAVFALFFAVAALHQLSMAGRAAPVALDTFAGIAQLHGVEFRLAAGFFRHGGQAGVDPMGLKYGLVSHVWTTAQQSLL
jgi:hypothetical protein